MRSAPVSATKTAPNNHEVQLLPNLLWVFLTDAPRNKLHADHVQLGRHHDGGQHHAPRDYDGGGTVGYRAQARWHTILLGQTLAALALPLQVSLIGVHELHRCYYMLRQHRVQLRVH